MAFHNAYLPHLYKQLENNGIDKKRTIVKFTYVYFIAVAVMAIIFTLISTVAIHYFLSSHYQESSKYVVWAMFAQAFQGMYLMVGIFIFYAKKTHKIALATTIVAVLQLGLSYVLVKYIGPIGAAYSSCIIGFINVLIVWYFSAKAFSLPWFNFGRINE